VTWFDPTADADTSTTGTLATIFPFGTWQTVAIDVVQADGGVGGTVSVSINGQPGLDPVPYDFGGATAGWQLFLGTYDSYDPETSFGNSIHVDNVTFDYR